MRYVSINIALYPKQYNVWLEGSNILKIVTFT